MRPHGLANSLRRSERDPERFTEFYDRVSHPLHVFMARRVYDQQVALDLAAETLAQAYISRHRFRGSTDEEARGWLFAIGRKHLAMYFRRAKVERRALRRLSVEVPILDEDESARLDRFAGVDDARAVLATALEKLSFGQRDALRLRVIDELPYREVAERLDISEGAARVRVARALKTLSQVPALTAYLEEAR